MKLIGLFLLTSLAITIGAPNMDGYHTLATIDVRVRQPPLPIQFNRSSKYRKEELEWGPEMPDASPELHLIAETLEEVKAAKSEQSDSLMQIKELLLQMDEKLGENDHQRCGCNPADNPDVRCMKNIIAGTQWPGSTKYAPKNVLTDSCDDAGDSHDNVYWWVPPATTGEGAFFTMDLGCSKCINRVVLRNSGNGSGKNGGTKEFLVSVATESRPTTWIPVAKGSLEDVRNVACHAQPGKKTFLFDPREVCYVKLEIVSFYGAHAALEFFDVE